MVSLYYNIYKTRMKLVTFKISYLYEQKMVKISADEYFLCRVVWDFEYFV